MKGVSDVTSDGGKAAAKPDGSWAGWRSLHWIDSKRLLVHSCSSHAGKGWLARARASFDILRFISLLATRSCG